MLLCDAAQVSDGKLFILGGGWSMTGPDPVPSAVALKIDVDWHEAETSHHWELFLEDADGQPVLMETAEGTQPVEVRGEFTVSQPLGIPEGSPDRRGAHGQPGPASAGARDPLGLAPDDRRGGAARGLARLHPASRVPCRQASDTSTTGRSAATSRTSFRATSTGTGPARRSPSTTTISSA